MEQNGLSASQAPSIIVASLTGAVVSGNALARSPLVNTGQLQAPCSLSWPF